MDNHDPAPLLVRGLDLWNLKCWVHSESCESVDFLCGVGAEQNFSWLGPGPGEKYAVGPNIDGSLYYVWIWSLIIVNKNQGIHWWQWK